MHRLLSIVKIADNQNNVRYLDMYNSDREFTESYKTAPIELI